MNVLTRMKKLIMLLSFAIVAVILFVTTPVAHATTAINTDVTKYTYEKDDIYYSDGYFAHPSTQYDEHLASLSILMTKFSMNPWGPDNKGDINWFKNQSNRVKGFLEKIGFENFEANRDYKTQTGFDTIGLAAAKKTVGDYTLISVAVRSGGYYSEWANNVYLGDGSRSDYMHEGWYNAAGKLLSFVNGYIGDYNITGKVKLWMAGFSRGGAVTNLAAGLLDNKLDNLSYYFPNRNISLAHDDIYAYTFEAPQGANINSKTVKDPHDSLYNNIFNIVNPNDLVTKVAMSAWGFTRFGIDKFITTKFYDSTNFTNNRAIFKKIYATAAEAKNVNAYAADNFTMKGITGDKYAGVIAGAVVGGPVGAGLAGFLMQKISGIVTTDKTKGNYDGNINSSLLLEEACKAIGSRANYCKNFQDPLKDVLFIVMDEVKEEQKDRILNLVVSVLIESTFRFFGIRNLDMVKKVYPGFSSTNLSNIGDFVGMLAKVYVEKPNEMISLICNVSDMFQNHDTDVNVAHIKCQDSYYIDAYNNSHDDKVSKVALRDNADIVHMSFFGYNDVQVKDANGKQRVNVEGHLLGKSDIRQCDQGFAAGYYSYATEEKMELFFPVNGSYKVSFKSYSKKIRHLVTYNTYCQYITAMSKKQNLPSGSEKVWFNSDRVDKTINVKP